MIAEKGLVRGPFKRLEEVCGEEAVGSGEARSLKEAEDSRSVTAEMGPVGLFEDPICEEVYILARSNQSAMQADIQEGSRETFAQRKAIHSCPARLESIYFLP